jgi:tetratricopeptide (TPR) repeat protein
MALNNRGRALNELKRFDEAVISYDKALAIKPDFVEALNHRGIALEALQRLEKAFANRKQSLALALALVLGEAEALSTQGVMLHEPGLVEDTVANADEAVATQRDGAEAPLPGNA